MIYYNRITIYGAYHPNIVLRRLKKVRKFLRDNDYLGTILVQNYPDEKLPPEIQAFRETNINRFNFRKSIFLVEISDLNIFIFTFKDTTQTGITDELNHALAKNLYNFLIFTEYNLNCRRAISSLTYGKLEDIGLEIEKYIIEIPQGDDEKLCKYVYQGVLDFQIQNWE